MSCERSVNEAQTLSHSLEQMYVNTPLGTSKNCAFRETLFGSAGSSATPESPPPTLDLRQKRERSESLMLYHANETLTTKRRLRSRSRIGFNDEDVCSSMMSPPCTSKPRERSHSRSQLRSDYYLKTLNKDLQVNAQTSSVFMTPCSEETLRRPLQNRDLNSENEITFDYSEGSALEHGLLNEHPDYSSDSNSDDETVSCFEDKTKTKLTFDEVAEYRTPELVPRDYSKVIGRRMGEKRVDVIKELVALNCEEVCRKILHYLEPQNLQRVASVSKLWRRICKKDRNASPRLDQFIHGRKQHVLRKGKENLGHQIKFDHKIPQRPPFTVKSNTMWTPDQGNSKNQKEDLEQIKTNIMSRYDKVKCPVCGSPSRKVGDEECECDKCQEAFCRSCKHRIDEHHKAGKCAIRPSKSRQGKGKEVIGSKQSKSRLKRH